MPGERGGSKTQFRECCQCTDRSFHHQEDSQKISGPTIDPSLRQSQLETGSQQLKQKPLISNQAVTGKMDTA